MRVKPKKGSYLCECWTGFAENKTEGEISCDDINECAADIFTGIATHNCHKLADRPELTTGNDPYYTGI